jgi:hypothetical protein
MIPPMFKQVTSMFCGQPIVRIDPADVTILSDQRAALDHSPVEVIRYQTDTGNRDMKKELGPIPRETDFQDVIEMAQKVNAKLIVLTSRVNDARPGAYYIKGFASKITYDEIKQQLETNLSEHKHSKRTAWLLQY